jgi:hypothetical protein
MNVFGHDGRRRRHSACGLAPALSEQVPRTRSAEQGLSTITTASDEVKVSSAVVAMQIVPHGHSIASPTPRGSDLGHPPAVMKHGAEQSSARPLLENREKWRTPSLVCATVPQQLIPISGHMWPTRPTCTKESLSKQTRLRRSRKPHSQE